jgi:Protein of unknown function (DUF4242)
MPQFLVERSFTVGQEQMNAVGRRSNDIIRERYPAITWHHSHVALDEDGTVRTFCVYEAPSEEVIREHAALLGRHEVLRISEIVGDVTPSDFPS